MERDDRLTPRDIFNLIIGGMLLALVVLVGWYTKSVYGAIIAAIVIASGGGRIIWISRSK